MTKKKIYICGASDCFPDPDHPGVSWMDKLIQCLPRHDVNILAIEGASNFVIRLQVERALNSNADFIIVNFTSSVRHEIRLTAADISGRSLLDQFYRHHLSKNNPSLLTTSVVSDPNSSVLDDRQLKLHNQYQTEFFDLGIAICKNFYFIEGTLDTLTKSNKRFQYSLGGFEHPLFAGESAYHKLLERFCKFRSKHNLWDYIDDFKRRRPYFHIVDPDRTQMIAHYYRDWILCND